MITTNYNVNVLIVEDDERIISFLAASLSRNGYRVTSVSTGKAGLNLTVSLCPDIILLDLGLPDMDGCQVLQQLRTWSSIPVIIISARTGEKEKVTALDLGADDYITKPLSIAELMARIRTCLRHSRSLRPDRVYKALDLEINFDKRTIYLKGRQIHLTQIEYQLLALLAEHSGEVLTYHFIMKTIWGPFVYDDNQILRVNMSNIRRKIEPNPAQPQYVFTEIGIGYRIRESEVG